MATFSVGDYNELFEGIEKILKESLEIYGDKVKEDVKKEIDETVYAAGDPQQYLRTYDLRESVIRTKAERQGNDISLFVENDTNLLRLNSSPGNFTHGSFGDDFREWLPYVVNYGQLGSEARVGSLFGQNGFWYEERPYFTNAINNVIRNGYSDFKKILQSKGLNVK